MDERADFRAAIDSQPQWMARTAEMAPRTLPVWGPLQTVAVIGMGASTHASEVFVRALRAAGVRAVNLDAGEVASLPAGFAVGDHVIVISESGRSPESIAAARVSRVAGRAPIVVTNAPDSPIAAQAGVVVPLGGFTDSGVYTIGYTTTLVALAAIARASGVDVGDPAGLAGLAAQALAGYWGPAGGASACEESLAAALDGCTSLDIVGSGVAAGSAQAAALLFREATGLAASGYETLQYLHGPMESCGPGTGVLLLGEGRERAIGEQLRAAGVTVITAPPAAGGLPSSGLPSAGLPSAGLPSAVQHIVFAQRVAADLAALRHRDVGRFAYPQPDTKLEPTE